MFRTPATFGQPRMFGPPRMFGGRGAAAPAGVESEWCASFDGINDLLSFSQPAPATGTTFTIAFWIRPRTQSVDYGKIFASGNTGIWIRTSRKLTFYTSSLDHHNNTALALSEWSHVALVCSSGSFTWYINGVSDGSGSGGLSFVSSVLGGTFAGGENANCDIDDFRQYSRALSSTEVTALYTNISPPTTGLTFHLPMEEGTGTTTVDSVGGVTATLVGGATWHPQTPPKLVSGRETSVRSLSFDGVNDWVDCGTSFLDSLLDGAITLSCWAKLPTHVGVVDILLHFGSSSSRCVAMTAYTGGVSGTIAALGAIHRTSGNGNWAYGSSPSSVNIGDNNWHHLAIVSAGPNSAASILLYVDGVSVTSAGNGAINTAGVNRIGGLAGYNFAGQLDDVQLFSTALTAAQIRSLARGQPVTGAVGWWKGDETSGTLVEDFGSGGNDGTCVGGVGRSTDVSPWLAP